MLNKRCYWVDLKNQLYIKYHDQEWGVPVYNDRKLFEMLILEGAQAGLSWVTILNKRRNYRKAFDNFNFEKIAKYNLTKQKQLLKNKGIVRNRLKILATIQNAKVFIKIRKEFGTFSKYLWSFVDYQQIQNKIKNLPTKTKLSDQISADLKRRGMKFVGSTIIYSFIQAVGLVNDHQTNCFRYQQIKKLLTIKADKTKHFC